MNMFAERSLAISIIVNSFFILFEFIGGYKFRYLTDKMTKYNDQKTIEQKNTLIIHGNFTE